MSTSTQFRAKPARGMRDLLPDEVSLRDWATEVIVGTYRSFGFTRIETPAVENIELLKKGEGGENLSLIFEIMKRGEKLEKAISDLKSQANAAADATPEPLSDLGLRFDLTVPLARFFANNQANLPNPFKAIQIGSVWRAESPQQGRYRQFTQCDIDIIGVKNNFAELELLQATAQALLALDFKNFRVRINDRRLLSAIAQYCDFDRNRFDSVFIAIDKLDKIGFDGVEAELLKDGHPEPAVRRLIDLFQPLEALVGHTADGGVEHFRSILTRLPDLQSQAGEPSQPPASEVLSDLEQLIESISIASRGKYGIVFDPTLVRGMGYYTGPIFEVSVPGYSSSVAGGGRYDKMIEKFVGREVPACGFSIGFERIINILQERGFQPGQTGRRLAFIYDPGRDQMKDVVSACQKLHPASTDEITSNQYSVVSLTPRKKDLKKQLDQLLDQGFTSFCIYKGDPENLEIKDLKREA